jgi:DNA-binding GntR family transcriptional regulator
MRVHQREGDVQAFSAVDRTFHETIVTAAGNSILTRVYRSLRERQICLTVSVIRDSEQRMTTAVDEHAALVALLRRGDATAFSDLLATHIADAARHLRGRR